MPFLSCLEPSYCQVSSFYSGHHPTCAEPNSYNLSECWWFLVRMSLASFSCQRSVPCSEVSPLCHYNCISFSGCPAHTGFQFSLDAGPEFLVDQAIVESRGTFPREKNWALNQIKEWPYTIFIFWFTSGGLWVGDFLKRKRLHQLWLPAMWGATPVFSKCKMGRTWRFQRFGKRS